MAEEVVVLCTQGYLCMCMMIIPAIYLKLTEHLGYTVEPVYNGLYNIHLTESQSGL